MSATAGSTFRRHRRPFRDAAREPTRSELLELLRRLYGPGIPRHKGSPYAGSPLDDAELVLHELAHATQIPGELPMRPGRMRPSWLSMTQDLKSIPRWLADRHEIRAVAITLGASRRLRLPLEWGCLVEAGAHNSYKAYKHMLRFERCVERAERTLAVRRGVQQVLEIVDQAWSRARHTGVGTRHVACLSGGVPGHAMKQGGDVDPEEARSLTRGRHKHREDRQPKRETRIKAKAAACQVCRGRAYQVPAGQNCTGCGRRRNVNVCPGCGGLPERVEGKECVHCGTAAGKNQEYQHEPRRTSSAGWGSNL